MNSNAWCQMRSRKHREPASNVFFVECEGFSSKPDKWIKDGAPGDLFVVKRVVELVRADGVFRQEQRAVDRVPDGERPIPNEFGEAIGAPLFVGRRDDGNVRGRDRESVAQLANKVRATVQSAVPSDYRMF